MKGNKKKRIRRDTTQQVFYKRFGIELEKTHRGYYKYRWKHIGCLWKLFYKLEFDMNIEEIKHLHYVKSSWLAQELNKKATATDKP